MELRITAKRALEFEERTGKDIFDLMTEISKTKKLHVKTVVELFKACGENYTVEMFDSWEAPFDEKTKCIIGAIAEFMQGKK